MIEHLGYVMREEITGYLWLEWHIILPITQKLNDFFPYDFCIFYTNVQTKNVQKMYKTWKSNDHSVKLHFGLIDKSVTLIQNNRYS